MQMLLMLLSWMLLSHSINNGQELCTAVKECTLGTCISQNCTRLPRIAAEWPQTKQMSVIESVSTRRLWSTTTAEAREWQRLPLGA